MHKDFPLSVIFPGCTVSWDPRHKKCITRFPDGTEAHACPHHTLEYREHAREKSSGDVNQYCWQHDLAHVIVGLMNGGNSIVLWSLAHGLSTDTPECEAEEDRAQEFQRRWSMRNS